MFNEGDIVEIPLPDGRTAIGWILHISHVFKDALGIAVLGISGQPTGKCDESTVTIDGIGPIYTHSDAPTAYHWRKIAFQPLSETNKQLTRRQAGGYIYVGDDCLGPTTADDLKTPSMVAMGMPAIYREIVRVFGS